MTKAISEETIALILKGLNFNSDGLIPAISQQHDDGKILMMAWMNEESICETLRTGHVCFWSRSRQKLWRKGESSGQIQTLHELRWDCDADTLLLKVEQKGVACHTGRKTCFFYAVRSDKITEIVDVEIDPSELYG
ncbi:MAG: phosphoribosyl-AMP cyclohydrolase [Rhodospirillaceae bacterium TMED8]|nr:phosphoribosyl-AMP cyclohydrolase [Magnetovibrio sp.]OUT49643.1 MAG: phosphoribosyl-AMP cyclohydrolase [Rhodospirillaceae bacterium TMED8]|tara:strand:+ start:227 stop:634 length:408 start_codon:yes stop_codon:yes gene_type:complete